jgi:hypothetical protein
VCHEMAMARALPNVIPVLTTSVLFMRVPPKGRTL